MVNPNRELWLDSQQRGVATISLHVCISDHGYRVVVFELDGMAGAVDLLLDLDGVDRNISTGLKLGAVYNEVAEVRQWFFGQQAGPGGVELESILDDNGHPTWRITLDEFVPHHRSDREVTGIFCDDILLGVGESN